MVDTFKVELMGFYYTGTFEYSICDPNEWSLTEYDRELLKGMCITVD